MIEIGMTASSFRLPQISVEEAHELVKGSSRYEHSLLVRRIMVALAGHFHRDEREWGLVGLLHDLDHDLVNGDMSRHGVIAAEMLDGRLTEEGLHAIKAHDHRAGLERVTLLDESLVFADSLAVLVEDQGMNIASDDSTLERALRDESLEKPWIADNIRDFCGRRGVAVLEILRNLES
jgi:predicted hydrolase (HD superfamily)